MRNLKAISSSTHSIPIQKITEATIYAPAPFNQPSWDIEVPDQILHLERLKRVVATYYMKQFPPKPGSDYVINSKIPVVLFMKYVVAGEGRERQGIYIIAAQIIVRKEAPDQPIVHFNDVYYHDDLSFEFNAQATADKELLKAVSEGTSTQVN